MGFSSVKSYVDSVESGNHQITNFRKVITYNGTINLWSDISMSSGNPRPNFYAATPLAADTLNGNFGIYHGQNVSPKTKHLSKITLSNNITTIGAINNFILCDYLMYYPFIDGDSTDLQNLDNTSATLPRYTDGVGVYAMLVAQGSYTGGQLVTITYTNSDGVSGRVTSSFLTNTATFTASVLSSNTGATASRVYAWPFLPLVGTDKGIQSVQDITFSAPIGGVHAIVLVKPIANLTTYGVANTTEKEFLLDMANMPRIYDGAYLNFLFMSPTAAAATNTLNGTLETVWGE